ncbi:MAG: class I SAM-dependent methyltransferase, partial [Burkholderiaceae bacterium]
GPASAQPSATPLDTPSGPLPAPPRLLDLGCGRGEFLSFAQGLGFAASGVDSSPHMVGVCRAKGLTALQGDLLSVLAAQPDRSLTVISGFHVAEHLPFSGLFYLVMQAYRALQPRGLLILETPNPENLMVATHTFYHDHTHTNPLTPTALAFLLRYLGFQKIETLRLNPYPASAQIPGLDPAAQRLNAMVNGPQDFAVLGQRLA